MNNYILENLQILSVIPTLEETKKNIIKLRLLLIICGIIDILITVHAILVRIQILSFGYFFINAIWLIFGFLLKTFIVIKNVKNNKIIIYAISSHIFLGIIALFTIFNLDKTNHFL